MFCTCLVRGGRGQQRLPTHAWRLGNEWRRLMYGLTNTWRERRQGG